MRILVYGGGAVGLGIASCLMKSGGRVDVIARSETVAALREGGLVRDGIFGSFRAQPQAFGAYESLAELPGETYDYVLVCVKSFDTAAAAEDLSHKPGLLGQEGRLVLCQNGWGNAECFCQRFAREIIYNARVITGFTRLEPNEVRITVHADAIHVGSLFTGETDCVEDLCRAIAAGGIACITTAEIGKDLWAKMLYNCALNPLGAILRVPYGRLGESPATRQVMESIVAEVYEVMAAAGHETHWPGPEEFLAAFYGSQLPPTAAHESSMLQDILAKRPTEIDALTGAVIRLAADHAIPAPVNTVVYKLVKFLEQARSPSEPRG